MSKKVLLILFLSVLLILAVLGTWIYFQGRNNQKEITPISKRYYLFSEQDNGSSKVVTADAGVIVEIQDIASSSAIVSGDKGVLPAKIDHYQGLFVVSFSMGSSSKAAVSIEGKNNKKVYQLMLSVGK